MAIGAIQLHDWPGRATSDGFHVECVIQLNGRGIPAVFADPGEFRMAIGQVVDVLRVN